MNILRRWMFREVATAVLTVTVAFLGLFFFFDFIDELGSIGKPSVLDPSQVYQVRHALWYVALQIPGHVYELLPIAVLIGAIFVFARMAQGSEYTILRTSGLGPWRALRLLLVLGTSFAALTFVAGDHLSPAAGKAAQLLKAGFTGQTGSGPTGAWLKERQGERQFSVNVAGMSGGGDLQGIKIFEFDAQGRLLSRTLAASGRVTADGQWALEGAVRTAFTRSASGAHGVVNSGAQALMWSSALTAEMVSVALLRPDRMSTADLYRYVVHLEANGQSAQRYEIEFWRKVFYPLSCLVMMVLALPFAYLHFRSGSIAGYVFTGVMVGISFFLLNNVFGYMGRLNDWQPWLAAASPSLIYSVASLTAFGWLVLRR